jgi:hypothetical protein
VDPVKLAIGGAAGLLAALLLFGRKPDPGRGVLAQVEQAVADGLMTPEELAQAATMLAEGTPPGQVLQWANDIIASRAVPGQEPAQPQAPAGGSWSGEGSAPTGGGSYSGSYGGEYDPNTSTTDPSTYTAPPSSNGANVNPMDTSIPFQASSTLSGGYSLLNRGVPGRRPSAID